MNTFQLIASDYAKYRKNGARFLAIVFFTQGFWASFQYRIAHRMYYSINIVWLRRIVMIPFYLWQRVIEMTTGISIPAGTTIGHSLYIGHFGGIILNAFTVMGNNCNISQGVTCGVSGLGDRRGVPKIGDNVYIGANAVLAGKIVVGDNCLIGACTLVNSNIPDNAVVIGVPGVVVSYKGSTGYV